MPPISLTTHARRVSTLFISTSSASTILQASTAPVYLHSISTTAISFKPKRSATFSHLQTLMMGKMALVLSTGFSYRPTALVGQLDYRKFTESTLLVAYRIRRNVARVWLSSRSNMLLSIGFSCRARTCVEFEVAFVQEFAGVNTKGVFV